MPSPLSVDLRERVVSAVTEGASFHQAAVRFGVSVSSASRWSQRFAQQGHLAPKPTHGDDRLPAIEAHADLFLSLDEARPERFLRELRDALASRACRPARAGCHASSLAMGSPVKRMARPVRKWLGSAGLCSLHKRIRPSDSAVGQDGDPRVLGLIKGAASSAIFTERLPEHRSTVRPSSSHRPQTSEGRRAPRRSNSDQAATAAGS